MGRCPDHERDHPDEVFLCCGEIQCRYVLPRPFDGGYLCCALKEGHEGPHLTLYEVEHHNVPGHQGEWVLLTDEKPKKKRGK
jgi:hypothetical protein